MNVSPPSLPEPSPEELKRRLAVLHRVSILFALPDNLLRGLARRLHSAEAKAGSVIIRQGDPGQALFILEDGRCEVVVEEPTNHRITIAFLDADDFFGEMSLLSNAPRSASVRAMTDCRLLVLDHRAFYECLPPDSDAFLELINLVEQRTAIKRLLLERTRAVADDHSAAMIAVYSPKGGSGCTSLAVNLAAQLAREHPAEVLLADLAVPFSHAALITNMVPTRSLAQAAHDPANFEENLLSSILHHPQGIMVLPGVLLPHEAELLSPEVISRTLQLVASAFRFVVFDLPATLNESVLMVLESAHKIVLVGTPELTALRDIKNLYHLFTKVLNIVPDRIVLTINERSPRAVLGREDFERKLGQSAAVALKYDGGKQDEAVIRGEILALSDPKSEMAKCARQLATMVGLGQTANERRD